MDQLRGPISLLSINCGCIVFNKYTHKNRTQLMYVLNVLQTLIFVTEFSENDSNLLHYRMYSCQCIYK